MLYYEAKDKVKILAIIYQHIYNNESGIAFNYELDCMNGGGDGSKY